MKLNRWFVVFASTVGLIACSDAVAPLQPDRLSGRWAGAPWDGNSFALILKGGVDGDTLLIGAVGPLPRDGWGADSRPVLAGSWIDAKVLFHGPGVYQLGPDAASYNTTGPADEGIQLYVTKVQAAGTLVVTKYAGIGNDIEGTLSFDADPTGSFKPFGDRPRLEDGRFRATVHVPPTLEQ